MMNPFQSRTRRRSGTVHSRGTDRRLVRESWGVIANLRSLTTSAAFLAILGVCTLVAPAIAADDEPLKVLYEENVPVPMRDCVILRANVHRPDRGGPYPVLVMRTPYGKGGRGRFDRYVKAGYIVVAQDARGRYASDGRWESFVRFKTHDAEDGYDTVQWAAELPGCNGKVGTFGGSYNAFLQWRLAPLRPLTCPHERYQLLS